jgi:hypothetical protein
MCAHLEEIASGEGDPSKLEKRRNQLSVGAKARQIFKSVVENDTTILYAEPQRPLQ